jgi:ABC-type transport system substrate-binding protein
VNLLKTGEVDAIQIDPQAMKVLENEPRYCGPFRAISSVVQHVLAYGPINPESWAYNPDIAFSYDQEKAAQLLQQAGFKKGRDGILEKDGQKLEFDIV